MPLPNLLVKIISDNGVDYSFGENCEHVMYSNIPELTTKFSAFVEV